MIHSYGKNPNFEDFLKISRTFNLPDLWGLPSWYLGLSVKKKFRYLTTSLQVHVMTLYINEYLPFRYVCACIYWGVGVGERHQTNKIKFAPSMHEGPGMGTDPRQG